MLERVLVKLAELTRSVEVEGKVFVHLIDEVIAFDKASVGGWVLPSALYALSLRPLSAVSSAEVVHNVVKHAACMNDRLPSLRIMSFFYCVHYWWGVREAGAEE